MGIIHSKESHSNVVERQISQSSAHSFSSEDSVDNLISEDILIEVLSHVPVKDLIFSCRLVCKQWRSVIDAQSVWKLKCDRENVKLPTRKFPELPDHHYRYIYCHSISKNKNLIMNPYGENKFQNWNLNTSGFIIENPPIGADPVPAEVGSQSCFATTHYLCEKYQMVNLAKNAINEYLLHYDLVKIKIGEWYAARFDCASEYKLNVVLYDDNYKVIDNFEFSFEEEQWLGKEWHLVTHEFDTVADACYIRFHHQGNDRQFWAGHYGSKMTGAFVELCIK